MLHAPVSVLGLTMEDAVVTAASAVAVAVLVGVIYLAGFRATSRLDGTMLENLAAAEGARVEQAALDSRGRAALARLSNGKLLAARVLGDVVGARVVPASGAEVRLKRGRARVSLGDIGFPTFSLRLEGEAPSWLRDLARG